MTVETIEFVKETLWSHDRDSLFIKAYIGERRVLFLLPFEVACFDRLNEPDQKRATIAYFEANRQHVEAIAARLAERSPDGDEIVIRQV